MVTKLEVYNAYRVVTGKPLKDRRWPYNTYFSKLIVELAAAYAEDKPEILEKIKDKDPWLYHKVVERLKVNGK